MKGGVRGIEESENLPVGASPYCLSSKLYPKFVFTTSETKVFFCVWKRMWQWLTKMECGSQLPLPQTNALTTWVQSYPLVSLPLRRRTIEAKPKIFHSQWSQFIQVSARTANKLFRKGKGTRRRVAWGERELPITKEKEPRRLKSVIEASLDFSLSHTRTMLVSVTSYIKQILNYWHVSIY